MRLGWAFDGVLWIATTLQAIFWLLVLCKLAVGFMIDGGDGAVHQMLVFGAPLSPQTSLESSAACDDCCLLKLVVRAFGAMAVATLGLSVVFCWRWRAAIHRCLDALGKPVCNEHQKLDRPEGVR